MSLIQRSVCPVRRGVYSVHLLHLNQFTMDLMECSTVFAPGLCHQLKIQKAVAGIDSFLNRDSLSQTIFDCPGYHHRIVVDVKSTGRGNSTHEHPAFNFRGPLHWNLNVIIYVFLAYHLDEILFKFKPSSVLPLLGNPLISINIPIIQADHDAICIELYHP